MRRELTFECAGDRLAATLDAADGRTGLLIVSGGNEIRIGAHRGMARLAASLAAKGVPVFRFDRRGIGDSEGENGGYAQSAPDLGAALAAFRSAQPQLARIVAFGNCDAATAIVLHAPPVDAWVLANPWVIETTDALPPPAAIRARYADRLRDPAAWRALLTGGIDLAKLVKGLGKLASARPAAAGSLAERVLSRLSPPAVPTTIVLARGDATAIAFDDVWRARHDVDLVHIDSASHSFAEDGDLERLEAIILGVLRAA